MVRVLIFGSRDMRYRTGCCGSRSQEEVCLSYITTLYRQFGQRRLHCRYVDINDSEAQDCPDVLGAVQRSEIGLPAATLNGDLILHGQGTLYQLPDYIKTAIDSSSPTKCARVSASCE